MLINLRASILFILVSTLILALTTNAAIGETAPEYNPHGAYTSGKIYTVALPSNMGQISKPSVFIGSFKPYTNPFTGEQVMIPDQGEYRDPRGLRFVGAFDYIPNLYSGSFVFAGDRFDDLADEDENLHSSGIFVSQYEAPLSTRAFTLCTATPEYVEKLSSSYRNALIAEQGRRERIREVAAQDSQNVSSFLSFASNALSMFGGVGNIAGGLGKLGNIASLTINGTSKMNMATMALDAMMGVVTEDLGVKQVLSGAVGDKMKALIKKSGGAKSDQLLKALDLLTAN